MEVSGSPYPVISALDALTGALFLLTALGVLATRQVLASLQLFIAQSLLLTLSAALLGIALGSLHLLAVAAITIATKTLLIPWVLRHTVSAEVYRTREIERVLNIPTSLLIAALLVVLAYVVANPLLGAVEAPFAQINLPLGIAAMFLGIFTVVVRREAVPQLLGLLALENGVFFRRHRHRPEPAGDRRARRRGRRPGRGAGGRHADAAHSHARRNHCGRPAGRVAGALRRHGACRHPHHCRRSPAAFRWSPLGRRYAASFTAGLRGHRAGARRRRGDADGSGRTLEALADRLTCDGLGALDPGARRPRRRRPRRCSPGAISVARAARRCRGREQRTTASTICSSSRCSRCRCWPTSP